MTYQEPNPILVQARHAIADKSGPERVQAVLRAVEANQRWRGQECLNLLAPEALVSPTVRNLLSSELCQRAAEGEIGNRWFSGLRYIDEIEALCVELLKELFDSNYADHRLVSGMNGNIAVYTTLAQPGDIVMSLAQPAGGHSSNRLDGPAGIRGLKVVDVPFDYDEMEVDLDRCVDVMRHVRPRILALGASLTLFPFPLRQLRQVCDETGCYLYFDGAHQLGLVVGGQFQDPLREGAHVMTGSSGKTLSGPQGGVIVWNDHELTEPLRSTIFPVIAATHMVNRVAALAVAAAEMITFGQEYMAQIVKNAQALGAALEAQGFKVIGAHKGYTRTQQILVDVGDLGSGYSNAERLATAGITVNKNLLPADAPENWDRPSGLRLGTTEVTRLGMKEGEMETVADFIARVIIHKEDVERIAGQVKGFRATYQKVQYCFDT